VVCPSGELKDRRYGVDRVVDYKIHQNRGIVDGGDGVPCGVEVNPAAFSACSRSGDEPFNQLSVLSHVNHKYPHAKSIATKLRFVNYLIGQLTVLCGFAWWGRVERLFSNDLDE
jgi:hypothetical protein